MERKMAKKVNEKVINVEAVLAPYFVEVDGQGFQQVMDITGRGEETRKLYDRQNGEWVEAISDLNYLNKDGTEYLPGEIELISDEDLKEVLEIWDKMQKENKPLYSEEIYQYLYKDYTDILKQEENKG
jgi:hypothetical protein